MRFGESPKGMVSSGYVFFSFLTLEVAIDIVNIVITLNQIFWGLRYSKR